EVLLDRLRGTIGTVVDRDNGPLVALELGDCHAIDLAFGDDHPATTSRPKVLPEKDSILHASNAGEVLLGVPQLLRYQPAVLIVVGSYLHGLPVLVLAHHVAELPACLFGKTTLRQGFELAPERVFHSLSFGLFGRGVGAIPV